MGGIDVSLKCWRSGANYPSRGSVTECCCEQWSNCGGTQGNGVLLPFFWRGNAVPLAYTTVVSIGVALNHAMHSVICSGLGSLECFVIIKCTKFGQLIRRNIIKIVATRCQILRLKCTRFDFGWGSVQNHTGGAYSARPDPLAGFKGPTSKGGRERKGEREGKEG